MRKFFKSLHDKIDKSPIAIILILVFIGVLIILFHATRQLVNETYAEAHQAGYDSGYSDGYNDGYEVGYENGRTSGYIEAYDEFDGGESHE